jgi:hypothetical protein
MVNGTGFGGYFEIIKFQKLELMTLPLRAGSQEAASKHASLYQTERNWVNGLTHFITVFHGL